MMEEFIGDPIQDSQDNSQFILFVFDVGFISSVTIAMMLWVRLGITKNPSTSCLVMMASRAMIAVNQIMMEAPHLKTVREASSSLKAGHAPSQVMYGIELLGKVTPGQGSQAVRCLLGPWDDLSGECRYSHIVIWQSSSKEVVFSSHRLPSMLILDLCSRPLYDFLFQFPHLICSLLAIMWWQQVHNLQISFHRVCLAGIRSNVWGSNGLGCRIQIYVLGIWFLSWCVPPMNCGGRYVMYRSLC